jgi:hypothetical protein
MWQGLCSSQLESTHLKGYEKEGNKTNLGSFIIQNMEGHQKFYMQIEQP